MRMPPASAYQDLLTSLTRAFRSLQDPCCSQLLGPIVPGATMTQGARVPGTSYELDPAMAAYNLGVMMGTMEVPAILPVADYLARKAHNEGKPPLRMHNVLAAMIEAREIRYSNGVAAVIARLAGARPAQIAAMQDLDRNAVSGTSGSRRSAGDAAAHAVRRGFRVLVSTSQDGATPHDADALPDTNCCSPGTDCAAGVVEDFAASVAALFPAKQAALIARRLADQAAVSAMPVHEFVALLVRNA